jgi:hypothetical protein
MEEAFPPGSDVSVGLRLRDQDGLYEYVLRFESGSPDEDVQREFDLLYDACAEGTIQWVGALYASMKGNPGNLPIEELLFDCILRGGEMPDGYALEDFRDDYLLREQDPALVTQGPLEEPLSDLVFMCFADPRSN